MIQRNFKLALTAGRTIPLVIPASQYDSGEQWIFTLIDETGAKYTPATGAIIGLKSDKTAILNAGTVDAAGRVVINETEQMTAAIGKNVYEILIDDQTHGSANFIVMVEPRPGDQADFSDSDLSLLEQAIQGTSETAIKAGVSEWMTENMTGTSPAVDSSLSITGAAADAKKTGDEISELKSDFDETDQILKTGYISVGIVSGKRNSSATLVADSARCTTAKAYNLSVGDKIGVSNLDSGYKYAIAGASNGEFVADSGWKTADMELVVDTSAIYFVNIAVADGSSAISPSDLTTIKIKVTPSNLAEKTASDMQSVESALDKLDNAVFYVSDNLFDYTKAKVDQIPNSWSGATYNDFSTLNGWKTSSLIPVEAGTSYCVVENKVLRTSYIVDFYDASGNFLSKVEMGLNTTVTAPTNAHFMYMFKNGTMPDFSSANLAIKVYSADMDYIVRPYGESVRFLTSAYTYGLYKSETDYYHFTAVGDNKYLIRKFKRFGVNNLLDLIGMYFGDIVDGELQIGTTIGTTSSDTIGPVSIHRGSVDNYAGSWSGGVHGITIDGTEYPTAEQTDLKVYCNGAEITDDGLYWGKVTLVATNDLYFPKSVTGADLSTATKAIKEVRRYELTDVMDVKVSLSFYATTYIAQYYGCQCLSFDMTTLRFPNNETVQNTARQSNYVGTVKENTLIGDHNTSHYEVSVKPIGLGTFSKNTGTASDVGYCYLATFYKFYFVLIANELGITRRGTPTDSFYWEATYNYYID